MTRRDIAPLAVAALVGGAAMYALVAGPSPTQPVTLVAPVPSGCVLTAPQNLTATSSGGSVHLSWSPVECARAYGVHREDVPQGALGSVTATEYTDRTLRVGAQVTYFVTGYAQEQQIREGPLSEFVQVVVQ